VHAAARKALRLPRAKPNAAVSHLPAATNGRTQRRCMHA
jgi:hypothetical protein